ncbi:MAG: glycosyltransferase family 4 protein [Bacteroidota bacterium]
MKKILIVDNSSWNIFNFRKPLVKKLSELNHEVYVVSPIDEYIHYLNETEFIKHIPCKYLKPRSRNPFRDVLLVIELLIIYFRKKPDLIIHFTIKPNIFGNFAARILSIHSISVVTGLGFTFLNPVGVNRLIPWLYKIAFKNIKKLVLYNPDDRDVFVQQKIISPTKCTIISGSGVNTHYFMPEKADKKDDVFTFLFIGRLLKDKGLEEYVDATKKIREEHMNIESWVVGDFYDANPAAVNKDKLLEWIEQKDILYLGKVMDVRQVIKKVDVLVLPSYREGVPRVILEAMSMGKPIITTDTAGCKETVVHGKNGFVVPVKNSEALALAMGTIAQLQKKELEIMGRNSRRIAVEKFDEKIIVHNYLELLHLLFPQSFKIPIKKYTEKIQY